MALCWRVNDDPTLNAGLVALWFTRGSVPVLLRKPIAFWFSKVGGPNSLSPLWIRLWGWCLLGVYFLRITGTDTEWEECCKTLDLDIPPPDEIFWICAWTVTMTNIVGAAWLGITERFALFLRCDRKFNFCHLIVNNQSEIAFNPYVLIDFSLTVKTATLIFTSGRGSAISSAKQGKSGSIYLVKN